MALLTLQKKCLLEGGVGPRLLAKAEPKRKRLHEGGVGPEMRSLVGLKADIHMPRLPVSRRAWFVHGTLDESAAKCDGDNLTSLRWAPDRRLLPTRHIEVKDRAKGQTTITRKRNPPRAQPAAQPHILAIVLADWDNACAPHYVRRTFRRVPGCAIGSVNLNLAERLKHATAAGDIP